MKTLVELKEFYETELYPNLLSLEETRKQVKTKVLILHAIMALIVGMVIYLSIKYLSDTDSVLRPVLFCFAIWGIIYAIIPSKFAQHFKKDIISAIAKFIDPNLSYCEIKSITTDIFNRSKLFAKEADDVMSEEYFLGEISGVQLEFAEVTATHGSGKNKSRIFKGLFFIADFNKNFEGETLVMPDVAQKYLGGVGQKLQEISFFRGKLIKLEDPDFEKEFVVYGSDQVESRYILSPSLMQRIMEYKNKIGRGLRISFVDSKMFVAISFRKDLFEPRIMRTILSFEPIVEYYEQLEFAIGIVEDLNLNTNLWKVNNI